MSPNFFPLEANQKKNGEDAKAVVSNFKGTCGTIRIVFYHLGVSRNGGTPKSFILIGFIIINHPFWGTPIFGNTHLLFGIVCDRQVVVLLAEKNVS